MKTVEQGQQWAVTGRAMFYQRENLADWSIASCDCNLLLFEKSEQLEKRRLQSDAVILVM